MAIVNAFQMYGRYTANASSYTLTGHETQIGQNVTLVVGGLFLRTVETDFTISSMTWNGTAMTSQVQVTTSSASRWYRAGIWALNLGNVGSNVAADVVATVSTTIGGAVLCAVTLTGVHQTISPITTYDTSIPADLTLGASSRVSPWALFIACAHNNNYGWTATGSGTSPTTVFDLPAQSDGTTEISAGGFEYTWPGLDVVNAGATLARAGTAAAIAAVAAKFIPAGAGALPPLRRPRTYVRM